ncbi:MAG: DUF2075 domain-containing protein [Candidatus Pacebacteria bacterium]|nr:DUF2075 domain-containing protein [Candidatus Paceibacterota bacterium]
MIQIETFPFEKEKFDQLKGYHYGLNWPVVYIQENGKEMYIGQTTDVYSRSKQHYENPARARLTKIHILTDEEFNLSSAFDFESLLIQYVSAEDGFKLQNRNGGLINHNYYDKEKYTAKLETVWPKLQEIGLVKQEIADIKNSEFFKYSPYKALTEDQLLVAKKIEKSIRKGNTAAHVINGGPGTGKSILALYLLKHMKEEEDTKHLKIALVVPMSGLRNTLQRVLKRVPGMGADLVIGPSDVVKKEYDVLIVDETHRLRRRVNLANFGSYDSTNKKLGLSKDATQLDWIIASSKQQIFFYDSRQTVVPGDVRPGDFRKLGAVQYELTSQMRIQGGEDYLQFVDDLLDLKLEGSFQSAKYDFKMYEDIGEMVRDIKIRDSEHKLARVVAGYAWSWNTKGGKEGHDIEIGDLKLVWNSTNIDWVNSKNAINEVGCIHTVQGYDLNYAGVIIGPELSYDENSGTLVVDEKKYKDINGKRSITDPDELKRYVINIYKTLLTRGIKGTYVYVVDEKLRKHFNDLVSDTSKDTEILYTAPVLSPITIDMIRVPLVGSAPCGNPLVGEQNIEEYILVEKSKIKPGFEYFILRAEGDSMNLRDINDGDLVLCRLQEKAETGDRVVALLGGENVTIKEYGPRVDGVRLLIPKSTNKKHMPITPDEGDSVQGVVQEVIKSENE